ncbi:hypothetical protein N2152v2_005316 [Parachlorella kessleri]
MIVVLDSLAVFGVAALLCRLFGQHHEREEGDEANPAAASSGAKQTCSPSPPSKVFPRSAAPSTSPAAPSSPPLRAIRCPAPRLRDGQGSSGGAGANIPWLPDSLEDFEEMLRASCDRHSARPHECHITFIREASTPPITPTRGMLKARLHRGSSEIPAGVFTPRRSALKSSEKQQLVRSAGRQLEDRRRLQFA